MRHSLSSLALAATHIALVLATARAQAPALDGFDPILLGKGKQDRGKVEFVVDRDGLRYQFVSAAHKAQFEREPDRFGIQFGGSCARMGPLSGLGDPHRWQVHKERIYVFATEQCRDRFRQDPEQFLDPDLPAPNDATALAAGSLLLERTIAAVGGVERLRAWRTYRHDRTIKNGQIEEQHRFALRGSDHLRLDHEHVGDANRNSARVLSPAANFFVEGGSVRTMGAEACREERRNLLREPLLALRLALDGKAVAAASGKPEELTIWCAGAAVTFALGADGRPRLVRSRARGPNQWFGRLEVQLDDWQDIAGLSVPTTLRASFDGQEAPGLHERREHLMIDADLPDALFTPPK